MQKYNVGAPFERVALDMLGPFPKSDKGNKYLLVVGDYFSKCLEAVPVPDKEATTVAKCFYRQNCVYVWSPRVITYRPRV